MLTRLQAPPYDALAPHLLRQPRLDLIRVLVDLVALTNDPERLGFSVIEFADAVVVPQAREGDIGGANAAPAVDQEALIQTITERVMAALSSK